jgi:hypothetical protein
MRHICNFLYGSYVKKTYMYVQEDIHLCISMPETSIGENSSPVHINLLFFCMITQYLIRCILIMNFTVIWYNIILSKPPLNLA